jgi:hypothetical protein
MLTTRDLLFEVRDASYNKVAQLLPTDGLTTFKATLKFNNVGSWEISIPETSPRGDLLRTPGYGLVITNLATGATILSGPTVAATNTKESGIPYGMWDIRGATDSIILGERLAYPTPTTADVTAQTTAYDVRTGAAETIMKAYVNANIGPSAPAARKIAALTVETSAGLGSTITGQTRFDVLGTYLETLANVSSPNLGFDLKQVSNGIVFSVYQPSDKTATIRMDTANNTLQKSTYGYGYSATRAIVAGAGSGNTRTFQEVTTSATTSAESTWSRRIEKFVDQNNTADATQLTQAGTDALSDGGTVTSTSVIPTASDSMNVFVDWNLGDKVSVVVGTQTVSAVVSAITITIEADGLRIGATVGDPNGFDFESVLMKRQTDTNSRITALETREAATMALGTFGFSDIAITSPAAGNVLVYTSGKWTNTAIAPVSSGGTGATSLTGYVKGNGTSAFTAQAVPIPIADGGTGATSASAAITALGIKQPGDTGVPFAVSAGTASPTLTSASPWSAGSIAVTFPTSRFSQAPMVTATATNNAAVPMIAWVSGITTTGFTLRTAYYGATNNAIATYWTAVQMTSSAGAG